MLIVPVFSQDQTALALLHAVDLEDYAEDLSAALCRSFAAKGFGARSGHGYSQQAHGEADWTA